MYNRIVIGMAPTDTARRAYDQGLALALALGASVHLVRAFDDGSDAATARRHAEGGLESAAAPLRASLIDVTTHALPGDPAEALLWVADTSAADLIVVGNKGAQGALRVLGSVAATVLAKSPCAVLVVHTAA